MKSVTILAAAALLSVSATVRQAPPITTAGQPAQLDIRVAGPNSLRVTLKPVSFTGDFPATPAVADRVVAAPAISLRSLAGRVERAVGRFRVVVEPSPLRVTVRDAGGRVIQTLRFEADGPLTFDVGDGPVLGMGEGGPRPARGTPWREQPVQFDRRGALDTMEPRWQADMYGSRNPAAVLFGTSGWGLFVATPWVQVDLTRRGAREVSAGPAAGHRSADRAATSSRTPARDCRRRTNTSPVSTTCSSSTRASRPTRSPTSPRSPAAPSMPPRWALGYMQSHRTLEDETQMLRVIDTFREKRIPLDAVIYLGTGFAPGRLEHASAVVRLQPQRVQARSEDRAGRHARAQRQGRRPHGPVGSRSPADAARHDSRRAGRNGGRLAHPVVLAAARRAREDRHRCVLAGRGRLVQSLRAHQASSSSTTRARCSTTPNVRPWSLQRNGFPGIAQWGGWVWSGDTDTSWKTLEAQIAVGLNYSLSIGPYWGSDIGGFYPNREYTGELYARWFQFAAFCGSFRVARPRVVDAPAVGLGRHASSGRSSTATTTRRRRQATRATSIRRSSATRRSNRSPSATPSFAISCCRTPTRSRAKPAIAACRSCARCGCTTRPTRPRARRAISSSGAATC